MKTKPNILQTFASVICRIWIQTDDWTDVTSSVFFYPLKS